MTASSGTAYTPGYGYNSAGANVNITGSPDWGGRVVLGNNLGSGCSSNQFQQFNGAAITGPTYGSLSMESGRNYLRDCPNENVDMSVTRRFRFGKFFTETRRLEFRADIFNALNTVHINAMSTTATFNTPSAMALQNNQYTATATSTRRASSRRTQVWAPRPAPRRCATFNCSSGSSSDLERPCQAR